MKNQNPKTPKRTLASEKLEIPLDDFILSRQAMMCTARTVAWYEFNLNKILTWFEGQGVDSPEAITSRHVRLLLGEMISKGYRDGLISNVGPLPAERNMRVAMK